MDTHDRGEGVPKILIADDNPANLIAFEAALESFKLHVVLASDGDEALKAAAQHDFAVILLDVRMPRMDGFEAAERLRQLPRTKFTPIVFTSAYDSMPGQVTKA